MPLFAFDLDGVIIDSKKAYVKALSKVCGELGFDCGGVGLDSLLGKPTSEVISILLPDDPKVISEARLKVNQLVMSKEYLDLISLTPDAVDCLDQLSGTSGLRVALVTNSSRAFTDFILDHFDLASFFDRVLTSDEMPSKEDRLNQLMVEFDSQPCESFYVGDLPRDVEVARNTGALSIAVYTSLSWVYPEKKLIQDASPDYLIESLSELPDLVSNPLIRQSSI